MGGKTQVEVSTEPRLSIVIPVYNEAGSVATLYDELQRVLGGEGCELIFVDDGSSDASPRILAGLAGKAANVRVLRFARNFGKAEALSAGFRDARGQFIVTLDGDLQDDPAEIPKLVAALGEGYDLASGWKQPRRDAWTKRLASWLFNAVASLLGGARFHDLNSGFKAYRRSLLDTLSIYGGQYRFIPLLAHWAGFRVVEVPVSHRPRRFGRSKYGARRFVEGLLDLVAVLFLTRFLYRPLMIFGSVGLVCLLAGLAVNLYLSALWFSGEAIGHRPLLILGVLLMVMGVQFLSMGLLGEMVARATARRAAPRVYEVITAETEAAPAAKNGGGV